MKSVKAHLDQSGGAGTFRSRLLGIVVLGHLDTHAGWARRKVKVLSETISSFKASSDVAPFFDTANGYAVFPNIGKASLTYEAAISGQDYSFKPAK